MTTFEENQRFTQQWLSYLLLGIMGLFVYAIIQQIILGIPFGPKPMPNFLLIISFIFYSLTVALLFVIRLKTKIDENGISIVFIPLAQKKIAWEDIKSLEIIKYDYVGYGVRLSFKYGTVYNASGK